MDDTHFAFFQRFIMAAYAKNVDWFKPEIYSILTNKELLEDFSHHQLLIMRQFY